jgi:hypothetical protein
MINGSIIIDNCIDNIDFIRNASLSLDYTKSDASSGGWKGYRCLEKNKLADNLMFTIYNKLIEKNSILNNAEYRYYFHCSLSENNNDTNTIHKDYKSDYAGVLYMSPNPPPNSGTKFYDDARNVINYVDNIYNRLVMYPSNIWHSVNNSFGHTLETGRLTFTIFCSFNKKNISSII